MSTTSEIAAAWARPGVFLAAFVTWAGAWGWVAYAARLGLVDRPGPERHKRGVAAVPAVGGLALAGGLFTAWLAGGIDPTGTLIAPDVRGRDGAIALALALALGVGVADDRRAWTPWAKLAGQAAAGLVLAAPLLWSDPLGRAGDALFVVAGAVVAQNALNTFDNADGALLGVVTVVLAWVFPAGAAACAGAFVHNLGRGGARPRLYLGDGGSHLLGLLVWLHPAAWGVLALPLLDLGRLVFVRWRAGDRPWAGDRRHLAHRLQRRGAGAWGVVLVLCAVGGPSGWLWAGAGSHRSALAWAGVGLTALLFGIVLGLTRRPVSAAGGESQREPA